MALTVRELIETLQTLDQDQLVVLSKDAEGNNFSPLEDYSTGRYEATSTWSGEVYSQEDIEEGFGDDGLPTVVVLWPVN